MVNQWSAMGWARFVVLLLLTQTCLINGLSWGRKPKLDLESQALPKSATARGSVSQLMGSGLSSPSPYEVALNELRELESGPLCHRTAARLLVTNCELLDGKDEATYLTDSGRMIWDFVAAYALSLAICDLERGGFHIPRECANFREPVLNGLPTQSPGQLHNTWVSYRHRAQRFCEVARADNEKDQHILLFRRLAETMGRFTDDIGEQFEQHLNDMDSRSRATGAKVDELSPKVDRLKDSLQSVEDIFLRRISVVVEETMDAVNTGKENALNLQRMLEVMFRNVLKGQAEIALSYEQSVQVATQRAESAVNSAMGVAAVLTESATQLQSQIELSRLQAVKLESKQENLERGMKRLIDMSENLTSKYADHTDHLVLARNITNEILDILEDTAASANYVGSSILKRSYIPSWWPYIWCPAVSLVLGSYGLPPSATRNVALLALGEVAGFTYSTVQSLPLDFSSLSITRISILPYPWGNSSGNSSEDASPILNTTNMAA
ncbi:hypothetical protein F4776DRAFT_672635 [Hypoxylon sp. NC0597]|nr:hypothetical protein F4776DRAFT_672635 [Hypoxylon sp. NC0597]